MDHLQVPGKNLEDLQAGTDKIVIRTEVRFNRPGNAHVAKDLGRVNGGIIRNEKKAGLNIVTQVYFRSSSRCERFAVVSGRENARFAPSLELKNVTPLDRKHDLLDAGAFCAKSLQRGEPVALHKSFDRHRTGLERRPDPPPQLARRFDGKAVEVGPRAKNEISAQFIPCEWVGYILKGDGWGSHARNLNNKSPRVQSAVPGWPRKDTGWPCAPGPRRPLLFKQPIDFPAFAFCRPTGTFRPGQKLLHGLHTGFGELFRRRLIIAKIHD